MNALASSARVVGRRVLSTTSRRAFQSAARQSSQSSTPLFAAAGLAVAAGVAIQASRDEVRRFIVSIL